MDDAALLTRLESDVAALADIAHAAHELDADVPACPGWTVSDLFGHLWSVQSWVVGILRTGEVAPEPKVSEDPGRRVEDFLAGLPTYLQQMRTIDPERPCWGMGPKPRLAGYWTRRQTHEHLIHRVDLQQAGLDADLTVPADLAADGVEEVVGQFYPRQVRLGRIDAVAPAVRLRAADTGEDWVLGEGEPVGTLTAPVTDLYLGLWGRHDLATSGRVDGEAATVRRALATTLVP